MTKEHPHPEHPAGITNPPSPAPDTAPPGTEYTAPTTPPPGGWGTGSTAHPTSGTSLPPADERTIAALSHASAIIAALFTAGTLAFLGPFLVWLFYKDRSKFVRTAAAQSFNFNLAVWIAGSALGLMAIIFTILFVTIPLAIGLAALIGVLFVASFIFHIIAAVETSKGRQYTYPFTLPILN